MMKMDQQQLPKSDAEEGETIVHTEDVHERDIVSKIEQLNMQDQKDPITNPEEGDEEEPQFPLEELSVTTQPPQPKKQTHPDAMREVRAMIVAALPAPPMPIMVSREIMDEAFVTTSTCSSHDLIAHLMNIACTCATDKQNEDRALLQARLQMELFEAVDAWRSGEPDLALVLPPVAWSYRVLSDFTRKYVQSYLPGSGGEDVRFVQPHEVDRTHLVHRRAVDFHKAQDLLYGKCRMLTVGKKGERYARNYDHVSYPELVQMSVARILDAK